MAADVSRVCEGRLIYAIIDVLDGVADGHEELIMNKRDSDINYQ